MPSVKRKAAASAGQAKKVKPQPISPVESEVNDDNVAEFKDPMIDSDGFGSEDGSDAEEEEDAEDASAGSEDERDTAAPKVKPRGKANPKSLFKPPTNAELMELRTGGERGGTGFALQISALLASTLLPATPSKTLTNLMTSLHSSILALPSLPGLGPQAAQARLKPTQLPFPPPTQSVQWTLGFEPPSDIFVCGSWGVLGGYKRGKRGQVGGVDLAIMMPEAMFSAKDRNANRYFHKRAHYVAVLASAVQALSKKKTNALFGVSVEYGLVDRDHRRPTVVITVPKGEGMKYDTQIRLLPSIPQNVFPLSSLYPTKSLLKLSDDPQPTPQTSTSILSDTLHKPHLLYAHALKTSVSSFSSAVALWRVWADRRGLSIRGGGSWFATVVLGFVVNGGEQGGIGGRRETLKARKGVGHGLTDWQLLRAGWELLAETDFEQVPTFSKSQSAGIPSSEFLEAFRSVFVDPTHTVNIFASWEQGEIDLLRHEARETLAMLSDPEIDRFADVFLKPLEMPSARFDEHVRVNVTSAELRNVTPLDRTEAASESALTARTAAQVVRQGLGTRAKLVIVVPTAPSTWSITSAEAEAATHLDIGINFDAEHVNRVIDMGPPAEDTEGADAFRAFWGEKAELRRFKDGSISESVVWEITRPEERALIPGNVVEWVLQRHLGVDVDDVSRDSAAKEWLEVLQQPASGRDAVAVAGAEKLGFRPMLDAYEAFYKVLKAADEDLPLAILNVTPASELLRYSSVFIPHPIDIARAPSAPETVKYLPAANIVLQFESSRRWPEDLAAIQKVKIAMLEKIARVVMAQMSGSHAGIVVDEQAGEIEDGVLLEVLLPQGIAMRVSIYHEREQLLLQRIVEDPGLVPSATTLPPPSKRLAKPALALHNHRFHTHPRHHAAIVSLHHKYPSYSSATRLLKRWFASHMLSTQIAQELIELIMASVYLDPEARSTPTSSTAGFVRAVERLSKWNWREAPLFVPLYSSVHQDASAGRVAFPSDKRAEALEHFKKLRAVDPDVLVHDGSLIVVTEEDLIGRVWLSQGPGRVVAGRIGMLAKATLAALELRSTSEPLPVQSLFVTPLEHYDFVIDLNPAVLSRYSQAVAADSSVWESRMKYRNVGASSEEIKVDFDPAWAFVQDLQRFYKDTLLVFYDRLGGSKVGCLWNPAREQSRNLKPFLGYPTAPVGGESTLVQIDKRAILEEIQRTGHGLVSKLVTRA